MMTDSTKAKVWEASYLPFGGVNTVTGSASLNARFPGQWFQLESGLHYNWHRHYDATIARYTQPDPLGLIDGPSVYAYVTNSPQVYTDPDGRIVKTLVRMAIARAGKWVWDKLFRNPSTDDLIDDLVNNSKPGRPTKTKGKPEQRICDGGLDSANKEFDKFNPKNVREIDTDFGRGRAGQTSDGRNISVRPGSTQGDPTLQIGKIKFRFKP